MSPLYFLLMLFFIDTIIVLTRFTRRERLLFTVNLNGFLILLALSVLDILNERPWSSTFLDDGGLSKYFALLLALYFVSTLPVLARERKSLPPQYYVGMVGQAIIAFTLVGAENLYLLWLFVPLWFAQSYWFYGLGQVGKKVRPPGRYFLVLLIVVVAISLAVATLTRVFPNASISQIAQRVAAQESLRSIWATMWGMIFAVVGQQSLFSRFSSQRMLASGALWSSLLHNYYLALLLNAFFLYRWVFGVAMYWNSAAQEWVVTIESLPNWLLTYVTMLGGFAIWQILRDSKLAFRLGAWLQLGLLWPFIALAATDRESILVGLAVPALVAMGASLIVYLVQTLGVTSAQTVRSFANMAGQGPREKLLLAFISLALLGPGCSFLHSDLFKALFNPLRQSGLTVTFRGLSFAPDQLVGLVLFGLGGIVFWREVSDLMRRSSAQNADRRGVARVSLWVYIWGLCLIFVGIYPHPLYKYVDHLLKTIMI